MSRQTYSWIAYVELVYVGIGSIDIGSICVAIVKGEKKERRIFRDCPPIFYHWAEGRLREAQKQILR